MKNDISNNCINLIDEIQRLEYNIREDLGEEIRVEIYDADYINMTSIPPQYNPNIIFAVYVYKFYHPKYFDNPYDTLNYIKEFLNRRK